MFDYVEAGIFYIAECIYNKGIIVTYLQKYGFWQLHKIRFE